MAPRVYETLAENLQLAGLGAISPNPTAVEVASAESRLDVTVDVDRLVEVKTTVGPPSQRVDQVVGVFGTETAEHDFLDIGHTIAVGVRVMQQFGAGRDVRAALLVRRHAGRDQQTFGKNRALFGNAVAICIFQHDNFVVGDLARFDLRINLAAGDPQPPARIEIDLDRFAEIGIRRIQVHRRVIRQFHRSHFRDRVRLGDVGQVTLRKRGERANRAGGNDRGKRCCGDKRHRKTSRVRDWRA